MRHRHRLPQLDAARPFLADGGLETTLIFHRGLDLPCFAAFDLLRDAGGRDELRAYFAPYLALARERGVGFVLDTATWRANPDWARRLGYSLDDLDAANRSAVALAEEIRAAGEARGRRSSSTASSGRAATATTPATLMSPDEAEAYHARQVATFADSAVDMVTAVTMTNAEEAIGIARAARAHDVPAVISFTLETDGRLPDGQSLRAAIERVDAETGGSVAYFMINCAHPSHFADVLAEDGAWRERIGGLRANASAKSHAELDDARGARRGRSRRARRRARRAAPAPGRRLGARRLLRHRLPPRGGHRPGLDGLGRGPRRARPRAVSLARMWSRVVAVVAGAALAAGGFALGRATADTHAGHDAGVREGHAAGLQEGRALQATGSSPRSIRAAFDAGYAAGANDVFGGFDGGWSLSEPYVVTLARGSGAVTYRIDSRRLARGAR